jgi:hypothetical protein
VQDALRRVLSTTQHSHLMRSKKKIHALLTLVACVGASSAICQEIAELRADIRATYDFEPSAMTFDEQARRAPGLSKLWDRYEKNREPYRQALRSELRADGNRELLYCDGGMLLLAKSDAPEDQTLGLESIRKCSLAEIQHTPYFYTMHRLAVRGVDAFDLQVRILSKPKYSVFIVQHALTLGQDYAFLYPLLVRPESTYVPRLIALLETEADATAQKSVIRALWYAATAEAEAAVLAAATNQRLSEAARADAQKLLRGLSTARGWKEDDATLKRIREIVSVSAAATEGELRAKRMARMRAISDEALFELEAYTALIYGLLRGP